jgi:hypothetical protein
MEGKIAHLCQKHVKQLCFKLRQQKNVDAINKASSHLFISTPCELVVSILMEFVEDLSDDDYRRVRDQIHYALFDKDSVLYVDFSDVINTEIKNLLLQTYKAIQDRANDLNLAYSRRTFRRNDCARVKTINLWSDPEIAVTKHFIYCFIFVTL